MEPATSTAARVADTIRRTDANLRQHTTGLLNWHDLQPPEQERWLQLADAAAVTITPATRAQHLHERDLT